MCVGVRARAGAAVSFERGPIVTDLDLTRVKHRLPVYRARVTQTCADGMRWVICDGSVCVLICSCLCACVTAGAPLLPPMLVYHGGIETTAVPASFSIEHKTTVAKSGTHVTDMSVGMLFALDGPYEAAVINDPSCAIKVHRSACNSVVYECVHHF